MRENKRRRLKARGWKVGSAKDFLGLNDQEAAFIEVKLRLASSLRRRRRRSRRLEASRSFTSMNAASWSLSPRKSLALPTFHPRALRRLLLFSRIVVVLQG